MFFHALSFLRPLTLTVVGFQQFDDVLLNPRGTVALGEIPADIRHAEANLIDLVGFGFSENIEDPINIQFSGLTKPLHPDGLRVRGGAVHALHGFQGGRLFLSG